MIPRASAILNGRSEKSFLVPLKCTDESGFHPSKALLRIIQLVFGPYFCLNFLTFLPNSKRFTSSQHPQVGTNFPKIVRPTPPQKATYIRIIHAPDNKPLTRQEWAQLEPHLVAVHEKLVEGMLGASQNCLNFSFKQGHFFTLLRLTASWLKGYCLPQDLYIDAAT